MSTAFQLEFASRRQSIAAWGIEDARLETQSLTADRLSFTIPSLDINTDPPFAWRDELSLWQDGICRFRGRVSQLPVSISAVRDSNRYVVSNALADLDRTMFQDNRNVAVNPSDPESALTVTNNTSVILFQTLAGLLRTNGAQILLALQFALAHGVELAIGDIDCAIKVPFEEARDLTCAEVCRRSCRFQPDTVSFFDYTTNPPTLHFKRRGNLDAATLDLDAGNLIISAEPSPRYDLKPDGVKLFIERYASSAGTTRVYFQEQSAGDAHEGPGCIVATIPCVGTDPDDNYVPKTLAVDYFDSLSELQWEGTVKLGGAECLGSVHLGQVLNISNGRGAWASMAGLIQGVTEEIDRGLTSIQFGPPMQLGPQDFLQLARFARTNFIQTGGSVTRTSGTAAASAATTGTPPQGQAVETCDKTTGLSKTVYVPG